MPRRNPKRTSKKKPTRRSTRRMRLWGGEMKQSMGKEENQKMWEAYKKNQPVDATWSNWLKYGDVGPIMDSTTNEPKVFSDGQWRAPKY